MSEDSDNPELEGEGAAQQLAPGAQLRAARERAGLSVEDVAHELHLDLAVVVAVEADQLDSLGAPVFVKGYLRGYARLLDLSDQELVDAWQPAEADAEDFRALSAQTEMRTGASLAMFVLWVMLGILVLASLIYLLSGDEDDEAVLEPAAPAATGPIEPIPARDSEFFVAEQSAADFTVAEAEPAPEEPANSAIAEPVVAAPQPEIPETTGAVSVKLTFSDECWVEMSDSRRRLLYGLEKAGSVRSFSARLPLRFFVGNVEAVQIAIDELSYDIPARVRTGRNTARFVLSADDIQGMQ